MEKQIYRQKSPEPFEVLLNRYNKFLKESDDMNVEPIRVFNPLPQKFLDELELIREVSKYLQKKKNEDINKAAQAAKQEAEAQEKKQTEDPVSEVQEKETA